MKVTPEHVAIIPDGNGRWARMNRKSINDGHREGLKVLEKTVSFLKKKGVKYVTVYGFSSENWKRSEIEKKGLFSLIENFFKFRYSEIIDSSTKVNILGEINTFPEYIKKILENVVKKTENNNNFFLQIALNYGGRQELVRAMEKIYRDMEAKKINQITEEVLSNYLYTKNIPDPDLLIRTGDVYRISNFLLYQISYSEFFFIKKYWPDITIEDIGNALESFTKRERRFGGRDD